MTDYPYLAEKYPFGKPERLDLHPRYLELLRAEMPLARVSLPYGGDAWLATRYQDVKFVLADQRFSREASAVLADPPRLLAAPLPKASLATTDAPEHTRLRQVLVRAFTKRRVDELRPYAATQAAVLIRKMMENGHPADLVAHVARPLPAKIICDVLGVPDSDRHQLQAWVDSSFTLDQTGKTISGARAGLAEYLTRMFDERRNQAKKEDLLGVLLAACDDEKIISPKEMVQLAGAVVVTGHETTVNQIGNLCYLLLTESRLWEQIRSNRDLIPSAVEELLRYVPLPAVATVVPRIATEDVYIGNQLVKKGEAVILQMAVANRDPSIFTNPDDIDFHRSQSPHLAFGHGAHYCLGAQLARMELQVVFESLATQLPDLALAIPPGEISWRYNQMMRSIEELPVTW
ncbi:cytochrome P450 [Nocardia sp. NPDC088792]|uniref:cytochrome P450 n=1 Tax=Nocardia sp. NPDC088792 TaxID=3364332 RepID=UPI003817E9FB